LFYDTMHVSSLYFHAMKIEPSKSLMSFSSKREIKKKILMSVQQQQKILMSLI